MGFFFQDNSKHKKEKQQELLSKLLVGSECLHCPINNGGHKQQLKHPEMLPTGSISPIFYILGEAPGETEDMLNEQFVGASGQLLRDYLSKIFQEELNESNLKKLPIRFNNVIRCRPYKNETPSDTHISCCRKAIEEDIEKTKPLIILCFGSIPLKWITKTDLSISVWRGKHLPYSIGKHACMAFPIYHPSYVIRNKKRNEVSDIEKCFAKDLKNAVKYLVDNKEITSSTANFLAIKKSITTIDNSIKLITSCDEREVIEELKKFESSDVVALDIETTTLDPLKGKEQDPLTIAISNGEYTVAFPIGFFNKDGINKDYFYNILIILQNFLLTNSIKVVHNAKFELSWFNFLFGSSILHHVQWGDTLARAYILDERKGNRSLNDLCINYFNLPLKALSSLETTKLLQYPLKDVLQYNALDAKATYYIYKEQEKQLENEKLKLNYFETIETIKTLVLMEQKGIEIDVNKVNEFSKSIDFELKNIEESIIVLPEVIAFNKKHNGTFNYNSTQQLVSLLLDFYNVQLTKVTDKKNFSVNEEVLETIRENVAIADLILRNRELTKLKATYLDGLLPACDVNNRIRTDFNCTLTSTGRLSSRDPNMQNFPKRDNAYIRQVVVPKKGHKFVSIDYGQIEARMIAMASKDKRFVEAIWKGYDVHKEWTLNILKIHPNSFSEYIKDFANPLPEEIKKARDIVKNKFVFPLFYCAGCKSVGSSLKITSAFMCRKAQIEPNNTCTSCTMSKIYNDFWEYFSGIKQWQKTLISFYEKNGYVETLTGRRRHYPLDRNKIVNTPIQGGSSDIVVGAMNRLRKLSYGLNKKELLPILNIHDDLSFEIPEEILEQTIEVVAKEMVKPVFDFINVPLVVEVSIGTNWHELTKYKNFSSVDFGFM